MISILCPTRGRPDSIRRLVTSATDTATGPVEFIFYVDDDDPVSAEVAAELGTAVVGPRIVLSQMWNRCYEQASGDVLMHCGDDIVFRTVGWDRLVLDAFERYSDRIALVHGRDGIHDAGLATHGFLHRRWVEAVGYFVPPYFSSDYNDTWNTEVADRLGRRIYLPDVYTEHMHFINGKAEVDATHQERLDRHQQDNPAALYETLSAERADAVARLQAAIDAATRPLWTILIATLAQRHERLQELLAVLLPQVDSAAGRVRVVALRNNGELPLADLRQALVECATSDYLSFIDDDDLVPDFFVDEVLPLLDGVDYVGWRMQCIQDGVPLKPTFHSLRYQGWFEDGDGFYRDVSHLNPIRTEIAKKADYRLTAPPEDVAWTDQVRPHVHTEHFIERCMYEYRASSGDSMWRHGTATPGNYPHTAVDSPWFTYHPWSSR